MKSQNVSQAALVLSLLAEEAPVEKLVQRIRKACGREPTVRYVNDGFASEWSEHPKRMTFPGRQSRSHRPVDDQLNVFSPRLTSRV